MATIPINGQLILLPEVSITASHISTPRKHSAPSSSHELRSNAPPPRFPSLKCCCSLPNRNALPSSSGHLLNSLGNSLFFGSISSAASQFGGGGGGDRNLGGSGGDVGGLWRDLFSLATPVAIADEKHSPDWDSHGLPANTVVQLNKLSGFKKYKISDVNFFDRRSKTTASAEDSFSEMVPIHPGEIHTKAKLQNDLETLASSGLFEKVDLLGNTKPDGTLGLTISFVESIWKSAERFRCINVGLMTQLEPIPTDSDMTDREMIRYYRNQEKEYKRRMEKARPCMLPGPVQREMMLMLKDQKNVSASLLRRIGDRVVKWYQDNGYAFARVTNFGSLNSKELVCEVNEGDITWVVIQFQDKLGNVVEGHTQIPIINREIPKQLRPGNVLNMKAANQAVKKLLSLNLFSNVEIVPRADEKNEGGVILEINIREADRKSAEVSTEWSIVPGSGGAPSLDSLQPGGSVTFEHRNIHGLNRSLMGSVTASNLLNPEDDLSFNLEYVHPHLDGVNNPRNRVFKTSAFNSRKLSPVFTGGPGYEELVPPLLVDRVGVKANITENFNRQSKSTYGLVLEEITTRDGNFQISTNGLRLLPSGGTSDDGPPTTLSGTGIDRVAFLQGNVTRDNTKFVNGGIVGDRTVFQVDQGLGIGSKWPLFNRHQLSLTKFIPLKRVVEGYGKPQPPVLVLHGHYGGCVGDLPSYEAFAIGGPHSVRGYTMGELGASRNILELSAEIRVPVKNTHVYAFAEHGNDLGSSKDVNGNPTSAYRRMGHGSSYGVGVKLGQVRAEYAVDHNRGTGAFFLRFGERY
ncbi:hypothetical protein HA466_0006790 [Hirschfeldia incana]|nr:hypothetical protein HA466_0006790 [Hirschfeldia incana]